MSLGRYSDRMVSAVDDLFKTWDKQDKRRLNQQPTRRETKPVDESADAEYNEYLRLKKKFEK